MTDKVLLGINVDHVATLRQARGTDYPCPVAAALVAEQAGADYITMHLREDRRHIQEHDVISLLKSQATYLNFEMAITQAMLDFACQCRPQDCCLVPESRQELTTEGGLDVIRHQREVENAIAILTKAKIRVSLFIDANIQQIQAARDVGADVIEIHTGHYADTSGIEQAEMLGKITEAVNYAHNIGLYVNAGHGLTVENVAAIAQLSPVRELNIGHSIIARSVFVGIHEAVREMRQAIDSVAGH